MNSLKQQISEINNQPQNEHQTHSHLQQQESDKSKPFQKANQHEELTLQQIKEKFSRQRLTKITIPSSFKLIEDNTFKGCYSLMEITIPSSVTCIGKDAFADCTSLTQITIPSSVTSIGNSTFFNCGKLDSTIKTQLVDRFGRRILDH